MIKIEELQNLDFFCDFSREEIIKIVSHCVEGIFREKEVILQEGGKNKGLHIIFAGSVKVVKRVYSDEFKTLAILERGNVFGEMSFFEEEPPTASVISIGESRILILPQVSGLKLIKDDLALGNKILIKLIQTCSARIKILNEQIATLGAWWVNVRRQYAQIKR